MENKFIPLSVPNLKGNELKYVTKAIETEWVSSGGAYINEFEDMTAKYVNSSGAVACQSGTAGIHLALIATGVKAENEVIVPALTFIAAINPVKYVGAEPVFMDCDESLCMDMKKVEMFCEQECVFKEGQLINKKTGRHIKAMIVVHIFGNMADMELALRIKEKYNLVLIEDATEALGSYVSQGTLKGRFAGVIGDVGVFSFNGNKIITTGGGGMVVSNDINLLSHIKYLSTQAKDDTLYYTHQSIGYNYRMTNLQAAVGVAQLEQLEHFIEIKNNNYDAYIQSGIALLPFRSNIRSNKWFYSYLSKRRDELIAFLQDKGIQTRPIWHLICDLKPYETAQKYGVKCAYQYWEQVVNLPCSTNLTDQDIQRVIHCIKEFEG